MSLALERLLALIKPEQLEKGLFRGESEDLGFKHVFGGQIVGQALCAAARSVSTDRTIHSLHSYFLRPGDNQKPIIYDVEILRDGNSFSARRVNAIQNGQSIFYMTASFQSHEEGLEHQSVMPEVTGPDSLPSETDIACQLADILPKRIRDKFTAEKPLDIRPVKFHHPLGGDPDQPVKQIWLKANGSIPDNPLLHYSLLGYISDFNFLSVSLQPHGKGILAPEMQVTTIDHSIWFHRPFNLNQWLLYSIESTSASGARGFVRGEFFTLDGRLVASTTQEGLIRQRHKTQ